MTDQDTEISSLTHCLEPHSTYVLLYDLISVSRTQITLDYARDTKGWERFFKENTSKH